MPSQVWLSKICAKGYNKERKKEEKQIQTDKRYTNKTDTFLKNLGQRRLKFVYVNELRKCVYVYNFALINKKKTDRHTT